MLELSFMHTALYLLKIKISNNDISTAFNELEENLRYRLCIWITSQPFATKNLEKIDILNKVMNYTDEYFT
jgi:hypothetical protein